MSCPIYKDDDRTPFDVKCTRKIASQYSGIVDKAHEEETAIFIQFTNFNEGECEYGSPCSPLNDNRCQNWDIYGVPRRPIVVMPRPARMSNSCIVNVPTNKKAEFEKTLSELSLLGRVNTFPRQRDDTTYLIHFPDTNMFIIFVRLAKKWISPLDVLFPYKDWHALKFLCIVTQKKGRNHVIGRDFDAKATKVFVNPNLSPAIVMNEIDKIHLNWNTQEQIINGRIAANQYASENEKQEFNEWQKPDMDQYKPEVLFPQEEHAEWINDYYSKDVDIMEGKRKRELEKAIPGASKVQSNHLDMAYQVHKMTLQMRHLQSGGGIANVVDGAYNNDNNDITAASGQSHDSARNIEDRIDIPEPALNSNGTNINQHLSQNISNQKVDDHIEVPTPSWINQQSQYQNA